MVMLSDFLRYTLTDSSNSTAHLADVVLDLASGDYAPVTRILLEDHTTLAWTEVQSVQWRERRIQVSDVHAGEPASAESLTGAVLAARDIMDALIVDVGRRHTLRANDLWLREEQGRLWLAGADASPWAVLRRFGHGLLGRGTERRLVDWKDVEFLRGDPSAARQGHDYHRQITRLQPAEIAGLLNALPYLHAAELLTLIPDPIAADTLEAMATERQAQVIQVLDADQAVRLLELMAPDLAADLLGTLKPERAQGFLTCMADGPRELVVELLRYAEDTAGGIMTNQVVLVPRGMRVGDARRELKAAICAPDFAQYLYVVDDLKDPHLEGVVTLREFAVADDQLRIGELMNPNLISIDVEERATRAARRVVEEHLAALPVTCRGDRLLGAITVDVAIAQIAPPAWRDQAPRIFS
jgi:CBS domain-containing protein